MKNTEAALMWIVTVLERCATPYKISGGFAARVHGSLRELADIDIDVRRTDIPAIAIEVRPYIVFGPERYRDDSWDLELMTLKYEGQEIDIGAAEAKIFNRQTMRWEENESDLRNAEMKEVFGRILPVEAKESLIAYKTKLARAVDIADIRELRSSVS